LREIKKAIRAVEATNRAMPAIISAVCMRPSRRKRAATIRVWIAAPAP